MVPDCEVINLVSDLLICLTCVFASEQGPVGGMPSAHFILAEDAVDVKASRTLDLSDQVQLGCIRR